MMALLTSGQAMDDPTGAALRLFARHQRREGPGSPRCGFCRDHWHPRGVAGRLVDGCAARQLAAAALARLLAGAGEEAPACRPDPGVAGAGA